MHKALFVLFVEKFEEKCTFISIVFLLKLFCNFVLLSIIDKGTGFSEFINYIYINLSPIKQKILLTGYDLMFLFSL